MCLPMGDGAQGLLPLTVPANKVAALRSCPEGRGLDFPPSRVPPSCLGGVALRPETGGCGEG